MFSAEEYFFDKLVDKYKIETYSGFTKIENALKNWFKREHKAKILEFEIVNYIHDDPSEFQVKIEVPIKDFELPDNLTEDQFIDIIEGENQDFYDDKGLSYFDGLINFKKDFLCWDLYLDKENPNKLIITYVFK